MLGLIWLLIFELELVGEVLMYLFTILSDSILRLSFSIERVDWLKLLN